jgi:SAM-dependent methyltransferase
MPLEINYWNIEGHAPMLFDSIRCEAFRQAIADTVTPGCTVLDIGAGTGILSLFAAQAGARMVYAVERTHIADLARRIVSENGFDERIRVLRGDMETLELPEKVDVIVSEWLGGYGVDENLLPMVVLARDRWLKPGGRMIPETVTSWMAPAFDARLQEDMFFWCSNPYGIDLAAIGQVIARQSACCRNHVKQEHLLDAPRALWTVDARDVSHGRANLPFEARLKFIADREGQVNALAAWFSATLSGGISLCNGPAEPDTHWGRTIFPIGEVLSLARGAQADVHFVLEPCGKGRSRAKWDIDVEGYRFRSELVTVLTD